MATKYLKIRKRITRLSAPKLISTLILMVAGLGLLVLMVYGASIAAIANDYFSKASQARNVAPPGSELLAQNSAIGTYYTLIDLFGRSVLGFLGIALTVTLGYVISATIELRKAVLLDMLNQGS